VDLDPGVDVEWPEVARAARLVRELLTAMHLECFAKTTGGRGLHVVVPLTPKADWSECLEFARAFADTVVRRAPALFTARFAKPGRERKILIDYLRNNRTNTSIAAFSTRAKPGAPVSFPLDWEELTPRLDPLRLTVRSVPRRLARQRVDPWAGYFRARQRLRAAALRAAAASLRGRR